MTPTKTDFSNGLDRLGELFEDLLARGQNHSLIRIPRTVDLNDTDYVCEIVFEDDGDSWNISVNCIDNSFTPEEIYQFILRAELHMKNILAGHSGHRTIH